jgi:hypothetical protein
MDIITREQAVIDNRKTYYDGLQCANGHLSERRTSNKQCISCVKDWREKNRERDLENKRNRYHANPTPYLERAKKQRTEQPKKIAEYSKTWRSTEKGKATLDKWVISNRVRHTTASIRNELSEFLTLHHIDHSVGHNISDYVIDVFIPTASIAIDIALLSQAGERSGKTRHYHQSRQKCYAEQDIKLITYFSDEWTDRRSIVESQILAMLNKGTRGPGARKLEIRHIDWRTTAKFLDDHHLQGRCSSSASHKYGAFEGDKLVAVMVFANSRNNKLMELIRFCSDGRSFPGLAGKFFNTFLREYGKTQVLSFAEHRWSSGNLYEKLGFELDSIMPPDYMYTKDYREREHKAAYRKTGIEKKFGIDMSSMTEAVVMKNLGYDRIWDCGKLRYLWNVK